MPAVHHAVRALRLPAGALLAMGPHWPHAKQAPQAAGRYSPAGMQAPDTRQLGRSFVEVPLILACRDIVKGQAQLRMPACNAHHLDRSNLD